MDSEVVPLLQVHLSENTTLGNQPATILSNLQAKVDADSDGWLATLWDIFEKLLHWFTGKTHGVTPGKTMANTSAGGKQLAKTDGKAQAHPCTGQACCCEATYGLLEGSKVYQLLASEHHAEAGALPPLNIVAKELKGTTVSFNQGVADKCAAALNSYVPGVKLSQHKPCCVYTGDTGYAWAVQPEGCNSLEGTTKIKEIVGNTCTGCPKVEHWCPGVAFPTMFWETASYKWAQHIASDSDCGGKVFVLIPDHTEVGNNIGQKISVRIELDSITALKSPPEVHFVTTKKCQDIENDFCKDADFKKLIATLHSHSKAFCMEDKKKEDVKNLRTEKSSAFQCK